MKPSLPSLPPSRIPLRLRLTLWYTVCLALILIAFIVFLYYRVQNSLVIQVDAALALAADQALLNIGVADGQLAFQSAGIDPDALRGLSDDFTISLFTPDGASLDTFTTQDQLPVFPAQPIGFQTIPFQDDTWRVYSQQVSVGGQSGRLQVAQELDRIDQALASLRGQALLGLPLALLLAGLGGYFLADRALRPIDRVTQTARAVSASDLSRRIDYQGPADEVGRLARTFDRMLDRLEAAFAHERRFTDDAAHELRTPLTALKGRIGVTLSQPRRPADYQETLREMEEQVDRLIRLSNDLLFMARLDGGEVQRPMANIELADFMGAVVDQMQPLAAVKSVTLVAELPAGLTLHGDMDLLIRLYLNLLDNAIKFTPPGGQVTVRGQRQNGQVVVSVHDTGPGIPAEHLPHLFERFYRVEDGRARDRANGQGGAGLGLAIAYEIARFHGGVLTVQSEPGQGTTIAAQLPVGE